METLRGETLMVVLRRIPGWALVSGVLAAATFPACGGSGAPVGPPSDDPPPAVTVEQGTVTDVDGNTYRTVKIGNQWWMAENLRVTHDPRGTAIQSYSPGGDDTLVSTYGRLYPWDVAMDGGEGAGARGIAPEGWRIPSDQDWQALFDFLGGVSVAGGKLKEGGTTHWGAPNRAATDEVLFTALPAGSRSPAGVFNGLGQAAHLWSSTAQGGNAGLPTFHRDFAEVILLSEAKGIAASLRAVR